VALTSVADEARTMLTNGHRAPVRCRSLSARPFTITSPAQVSYPTPARRGGL